MVNFANKVGLVGSPVKEEKIQQFEPTKLRELKCTHCGSIFWEPVLVWKVLEAERALDKQVHYKEIVLNRCADCKKPRQEDADNYLFKHD